MEQGPLTEVDASGELQYLEFCERHGFQPLNFGMRADLMRRGFVRDGEMAYVHDGVIYSINPSTGDTYVLGSYEAGAT